jgi:hypothetical protein
MKTTLTSILTSAALAGALSSGCADAPPDQLAPRRDPPAANDDPTTQIPNQPGAFAGGTDNTHDHMADLGGNGARDPFEVLAQRQEEGPPEIRTRLHSCQKVQYFAIQQVLLAFGVNLDAEADPPTAGQLFKSGAGAIGAANYDARVSETLVWSASGAAKLFDIFVQAAPEIIANMAAAPHCQVEGVGPQMFDANDRCVEDAVSCLIGRPATEEHLAICDSLVGAATDVETGKKVAVATLLSAAHSCE